MENTHIKTEETPVTSNSETATASATDNNVVTSSSPTPTSSAFQPFQQLHEAVLAAVNSHNIPISHQSFMEAVAAATSQVNSQTQQQQQQTPQQQSQTPQQPQQQVAPLSDAEYAKKESIRASNRERKKKWRIHNEERNKDNDLRCRVNKRANKLFGNAESDSKTAWVNEEFEKRRQKRMDKERRKLIVNNVLSVPGSENSSNVTMPNIVSGGQIPTFYTPLPQIDTATAAKLLDFPTDLQRQLLEQLNNSMMALTNGIQQTTSETEESKAQMVDQAIHNLVESSQAESSTSNANTTQPITTSPELPTTSSTTTTTPAIATPAPITTTTTDTTTAAHDAAASSTAEPAAAAAATNAEPTAAQNETIAEASTATTQDPAQTNNSSNTSDSSSGHNSPYPNEDKQEENKEEGKEEKKPEYPMDAVLTLMQLNAGWRQ